eukprot:Nk52_evm27s24 gene=Nk52_evmTU27s24
MALDIEQGVEGEGGGAVKGLQEAASSSRKGPGPVDVNVLAKLHRKSIANTLGGRIERVGGLEGEEEEHDRGMEADLDANGNPLYRGGEEGDREEEEEEEEEGILGFTPEQIAHVQENFERIDVDGSGDIDLVECLDAFSWLKYDLKMEEGDPAVLRRLFEVYAGEEKVVNMETLLEILAGVKDAIGKKSEYESEAEEEPEEKISFFQRFRFGKLLSQWLGFDSDETALQWKRQNQKAIGANKLALGGVEGRDRLGVEGGGRKRFGMGFLAKEKKVRKVEEVRNFYGVPPYLENRMERNRRLKKAQRRRERQKTVEEEGGEIGEDDDDDLSLASRSTYTYKSKNSASTKLSIDTDSTFTLVTIGGSENSSEASDEDLDMAMGYEWSDEYSSDTFTYESTSDKVEYVYTESSYTSGESYSVTGSTITAERSSGAGKNDFGEGSIVLQEEPEEEEGKEDGEEAKHEKEKKKEKEKSDEKEKKKENDGKINITDGLEGLKSTDMTVGQTHVYKDDNGEIVEVQITAELVEQKKQEEIVEKQGANFAEEDWFGNTKAPPKAKLREYDVEAFYAADEEVAKDEGMAIYGLDNEERRHGRIGKKKLLRNKPNLKRVNDDVRKQLEELKEHRPYFIWVMTGLQVLAMVLEIAIGGLAPVGFGIKEVTGEVLSFDGPLKVAKTEGQNFWIGPTAATLILAGAKYTPCMRKEKEVWDVINEERGWEAPGVAGCCYNTQYECGTLNQTACTTGTAASALNRWNLETCEICTENCDAKKAANETVCDFITIKPCCVGLTGRCQVITKDYCDFLDGYWHSNKTECSQVDCLSDVCGWGGFASQDEPDQWFRFIIPMFEHVGIFHMLVNLSFQLLVGMKIERTAGAVRTALIYFFSAIGGNIYSAIFTPMQPQVGASGALYGLLGVLVIELFQSWQMLKTPQREAYKLAAMVGLSLLMGTLPWVDNWAHFGGFFVGLIAASAFLPYVNFGKADKKRKQVLSLISIPLLLGVIGMGLLIFYTTNDGSFCPWCGYFNCVPFTPTFCETA